MKTTTRLSLVLGSLLLVGGGCVSDVTTPVTVPLEALDKAKELTVEERARATEQAESITNEVGVVMILTEGTEPQDGMEPGPMIGCNDRPVVVQMSRESASGDTLRDALNTLFGVRETTVANLHNALAFAKLSVEKIQSTDGVTTEVYIKGDLNSGGVCDDPRITEQVEGTIRRFKPKYKVFWNGSESAWRCHGDMSGECK